MDCNEARPLLDARIDNELSAADARRIEQHLATCAECRREAQALRVVSEATRSADYFRAPEALRARLIAALPAVEPAPEQTAGAASKVTETPTPSRPGARIDETSPRGPLRPDAHPKAHAEHPGSRSFGWAWGAWRTPRRERAAGTRGRAATFGWPAGVAIAAVALVASLALVSHRPGSTATPFVDELVASHVRAQLSGHDIDVVSSDQHTVKPWFNGKLDYAPPVEDLAAQGFALTGGRLDYIDHRRVAVLVYRYRKHVIDVYVMPEAQAAARRAPAALSSDGYALARWNDHGMTWWAVSDAEPAVLDALHVALATRLEHVQNAPS
ncbi:MAG TPA: zf-HC2 domain-containing protein [Trinickia sp.]|jgi:anti-sigma factor (TIGR02949 family)|nr:zf-HC2 domain-containing protein [Trinickia sp.]